MQVNAPDRTALFVVMVLRNGTEAGDLGCNEGNVLCGGE